MFAADCLLHHPSLFELAHFAEVAFGYEGRAGGGPSFAPL
jgi:hypothetical protein